MPRLPHGENVSVGQIRRATELIAGSSKDVTLAFVAASAMDLQDFDFLFSKLQDDPANLLPESRETRDGLARLGATMRDDGIARSEDSDIPSGYTYFGQFVDHDITFETTSAPLPALINPDLKPLPLNEIRQRIRNARSATLDLDSVYGLPAPRDGEKMRMGKVTPLHLADKPFLRPAGKDDENDLPREGRNSLANHDRAALTGDPRNDENVIIQQMHVAFLRAHNVLVNQGKSFEQARVILRQHYQHIVIHDYLKRIVSPQIVDDLLLNGNRFYDAMAEPFFLPLEFSAAAFRFGHAMVRADYAFNLNFNRSGEPGTDPATLAKLFTFTAMSGQLTDMNTLPENWIIEWENFVDVGAPFNKARRLTPKLVEPLFQLPGLQGQMEFEDGARLAVRNLLRGYLLRLPTGQAVARAIGQEPLTAEEIEAIAASPQQIQVLRETGFLQRTPLWFYILAEAAARESGQRLGLVGGTIVAEVLIGLIRRSENSILRTQNWAPTLPRIQAHTFTLSDLLRFADVLSH